jgi:hypothetical protein
MAQSYKTWQSAPVAKRTMIVGFTPRATKGRRPHLVAVDAFDGVVLITIKRTGALIVLGICDIVWLWKATP